MLLSIVECSDHKKWAGKKICPPQRRVSQEIEIVGPVLAANISQMRNLGAHTAQGRWIFFKDLDCNVDMQRVLEVTKGAESSSDVIGAIGGIYEEKNSTTLARAYGQIQKNWVRQGLKENLEENFIRGSHLLGGALLVRKEAFEAVQGFSEEVGWGGEEVDLVQRLHQGGYKTFVNYNLRVEHTNTVKLGDFLKRAWYQNFNKSYYGMRVEKENRSIRYLQVPMLLVVPTLLFFTVSQLAQIVGCCGRVLWGRKAQC